MELVYLAAQPMLGLSTRTNNSAELAGECGKIAALWQAFFESSQLTSMLDSPMYGVYYDYESDMTGDYSVLVGKSVESVSETGPFTALQLREGNYLKFSAQGEMPHCVVELWGQIWRYFSAPNCPHQRDYQTDFEVYLSADKVEIYIGIVKF
ncbi:GyrI-like domain-containing protein [Shewanella xiamenensis]|uniref:GyrI-like domain-containing protein n=1 Tax=Shewanella xiamenensis TaxID=332186 RepID=A0AAW6QXC9_9GAMM|nr:GyrI-like domain-containing protein [Shewanella xiamenensis]MDG5900043.1 GyrI-like domain-containing protein [Shewanella xiamenensis]